MCFVHEFGLRVMARVGGKETLLIGQDDQHVGLHQVGNQRSQGVVVAKLDLVVDDGVVFVDDWHDAQAQQGQQGGARVEVALAISQVGVGEQYLRAANAVLAQLGFVHLCQAHLAHGRRRLQFVHLAWAHTPAQALHALGHGAAGDHDHFARRAGLAVHQHCQLTRPFTNGLRVKPSPLVGHQARPHLDHDATRAAQYLGTFNSHLCL